MSNFQTLERIFGATEEELSFCPGIGPLKAKRLYRVLHDSFRKDANPAKKNPIIWFIAPVKSFNVMFIVLVIFLQGSYDLSNEFIQLCCIHFLIIFDFEL